MPRPKTVTDEERERRRGGWGQCDRCKEHTVWTEWAQTEFGTPYMHLCEKCRRRKWMLKRYGIDTDTIVPTGICQLCHGAKAISPLVSKLGSVYFLCRRCITAAKCMKGDPKMTSRLTQVCRGTLKGGKDVEAGTQG